MPDVRSALAAIDASPRPPGSPLEAYQAHILSQHEEDGLTYELLKRAGMTTRRCVEIGCGHNGGNAGFMVAGLGFTGLFLDGDPELVGMGRQLFRDLLVTIEPAWITRETVNDLLRQHGMTGEIDYLGIDLDGVDYWIWDAITVVSPRLVIVEYNPAFGLELAVTIPYRPDFSRHRMAALGTRAEYYHGVSLAALARLAKRKGYRLVATAPASQNAYFLRNDVALGTPAITASTGWRVPTKLKHRLALARVGNDPLRYFAEQGAPLVDVTGTVPRLLEARRPCRSCCERAEGLWPRARMDQ